jgi:hypothetical protein
MITTPSVVAAAADRLGRLAELSGLRRATESRWAALRERMARTFAAFANDVFVRAHKEAAAERRPRGGADRYDVGHEDPALPRNRGAGELEGAQCHAQAPTESGLARAVVVGGAARAEARGSSVRAR